MSTPLDVQTLPLAGVQLIEASAGSGKTWAICALYLRLLLERGLAVQQVRVVTFTKAATAELRSRLRARLLDARRVLAQAAAGAPHEPAAAATPGADRFVPDLVARLQGQGALLGTLQQRVQAALESFDEAAVSTIHGFCHRALRDAAFEAGLPLEQEALADDSALRQQVVDDFWRRAVARADADPTLVALLLERKDSPARWAQLLQRHLARPLAPLAWPAGIDTAPGLPQLRQALAQAHAAARQAWQLHGPAAVRALQAALPRMHGGKVKAGAVEACADAWAALMAEPADAATAIDPPEIRLARHCVQPPPKPLLLMGSARQAEVMKKNEAPPAHPVFGTAQALLDAWAACHQGLALARLRLLRQLLHEGAAALAATKQAQRVLAYDDMLLRLHQRLQAPGGDALAATLRQQAPAALIDEFQDTDALQWAVFRRIWGPGAGQNVADGGVAQAAGRPPTTAAAASAPALILVGDPKQAIYAFRSADLHTYLRARAEADAVHTLAQNQRASAALIRALNHLFGRHPQAFVQPGLQHPPASLGAKPRQPLHDASGQPRAALQLWTLPQPRGRLLDKPQALAEAAASCAAEIARLLAEGRAGRIRIGTTPLAASDIAVLVRSHAQGSRMREALAAWGIASVELSQASVWASPDAAELQQVLAAMLEPAHEGRLKAALATRLLGHGAAGIDALAADEPAWLAQVQAMAQAGQRWRSRGIALALAQWRQQQQVDARLLAAPDGARRLTNLLHLAELLHQAEADQPSPEALLRWLDAARREAGADEATQLRLASDSRLVQIVTIHRSKGLEYPVVFCPFLWDHPGAPRDEGPDGRLHRQADGEAVLDFRAGFDDAIDDATARAVEAAAEQTRLAYVALTRAVHRCVLVAGVARQQAGRHATDKPTRRGVLHWLLLGDGRDPADWFDGKRDGRKGVPPLPEADALLLAWQAWAAALGEPEALAVQPLPPPAQLLPAGVPAPDASSATPQALPLPATLPQGWWIASFSSLAAGADAMAIEAERPLKPQAAADHDALATQEQAAEAGAVDAIALGELSPGGLARLAMGDALALTPTAALAPAPALAQAPTLPTAVDDDDPLRFPRGTEAGDCVHFAFEQAEFTQPASWPQAAAAALQRHPVPQPEGAPPLQPMLTRLLRDTLQQPLPLPGVPPLALAQLAARDRIAEMEFHLHAPRLAAGALTALLQRHGVPVPALGFGQLQGWLKGYIDLVFRHGGRWWVLDWKSNHLGTAPADYAGPALDAAMAAHHYPLQAMLYCAALHRWLQLKQPGYDPARHFGGAVYLFVRGLRPGWQQPDGRPCGLHLQQPPVALLDGLAALFEAAP